MSAVTTCMYSLPKFGLFFIIADPTMFYTVWTTSLAYLQYTYSFCEVPFSGDKLFHLYPEVRGCHLSQNCLVCESKVIFVLSHARYSLDTTIERKLSPSAIHFTAASILACRYKNCITALLRGAPVLKIQ